MSTAGDRGTGPRTSPADRLVLVLRVIAWVTVATGVLQVVAPAFVLTRLGAFTDVTTAHLFATVGMFMVVVGALLATTLARPRHDPDVVLWAAVQKAGAALAVGLGVARGVFDPLALSVAAFDLLTAALLLLHLRRLPHGRRTGAS
ncbi:hypothetical protein [Cellulomonas sp. S1-8]|uniref:hypothetical protein n=1 Tax=Cellulomonas sp. S1-8 TaxID=2904790 RepID=UPI002243BFA9|nr:hypothetical protein [Cellulomonas sp. S1-8]UZN04649.1 hypothetical protein OKX07_06975 [Cellulomonas sp. S1-8]